MSTKTSIKRIALVAVAALGFGMVTTTGAFAGEASTGVVTDVIPTVAAASIGVNTNNLITVKIKHGVLASANDFITIKGVVVTKPTGSVTTFATPTAHSTVNASNTVKSGVTFGTTGTSSSLALAKAIYATDGTNMAKSDSTSVEDANGLAIMTVNFQADTAGAYSLRFWQDVDGSGTYTSGEQYGDVSITAVAAGSAITNVAAATGGTATNIFGAGGSVTIGTIAPVRVSTPFMVPVNILTGNTTLWTNAMILDGSLSVASSPASSVITCAAEEGGSYTADNCTNLAVKISTASNASDSYIETGTTPYTAGYAADGTTAAHDKSVWRAVYWVKVDTAGTYQFNASMVDAGSVTKSTATVTTVATRGAATSITITPLSTTTTSDSDLTDAIAAGTSVLVSLKDTNGYATVLSATETLSITTSGPTGLRASTASVSDAGSAITSLASGDFNDNASGYASFTLQASAAGTSTVTVAGLNGVASTVTASANVTFETPTVDSAGTDDFANYSTVSGITSIAGATYDVRTAYVSPSKTSAYVKLLTANAADNTVAMRYEDTSGVKYGIANLFYTKLSTVSTDGDIAAFGITLFGALANTKVMTVRNFGDGNVALGSQAKLTLTGQTAVANAAKSSMKAANINTVPGSAISTTVTVKDQFDLALASHTLTFAVAGGRNAITAGLTQITDANGQATFTYTDAGSAGTDTISVAPTVGSLSGVTTTVTYNASDAISTVTVTGPNTDEVVPTPQDISAGDGAQAGAISTVYATVKNAGGSVLAGVPVVFTISGTGAAIRSDYVTVYTNNLGVATTKVYAWLAGTYTITATAGGKTGTTTVLFAQVSGQGEARTITATTSGNVVTATVKDRFGNPIKGVYVYATRTGTGYFANGAGSTSAQTDKTGVVEFVVTGSATVTVQLGDANGASSVFGQSDAIKGNLDGALAADVLTAYVAGTSVTKEVGVGSTYDVAGINSATVDATGTASSDAIDAANEATDAANAATDAANAAAEAADAATAAAQDAQAAVAELATQVAALIAGIKAQITTLTNLVIKIQKKVKA